MFSSLFSSGCVGTQLVVANKMTSGFNYFVGVSQGTLATGGGALSLLSNWVVLLN